MFFLQKLTAFISLLILTLLVFSACNETKQHKETQKNISIITTLFPLYDFAKEIVKGEGEVSMLLPPSVEPHNYEPKPSDIVKLQSVDVIIYTGKYMEPWMEKIIKSLDLNRIRVIDASSDIKLLNISHSHKNHHHNESVDPLLVR